MAEFFLTFGSQYAHCDSWVRIVAPDYDIARRAVIEHFDRKWSMLYEAERFVPASFHIGELFAFEVLDEHLNYRRIDTKAEANPWNFDAGGMR